MIQKKLKNNMIKVLISEWFEEQLVIKKIIVKVIESEMIIEKIIKTQKVVTDTMKNEENSEIIIINNISS